MEGFELDPGPAVVDDAPDSAPSDPGIDSAPPMNNGDDQHADEHSVASTTTAMVNAATVDGPLDSTPVGPPTTAAEIVATLTAEQAIEGTDAAVDHVVETDEGKPDDAKPRATDRRRALLRAQGISEAAIDELLPKLTVTRKTQRQLPVDATVNSPEMVAFFDGRDDAQIVADCIKGIRNDGGPYGPAGMYERVLIGLGADAIDAQQWGEVLAAKVGHRIMSIRVNVVATVNELARRRAIREGKNPRSEKYLKVR